MLYGCPSRLPWHLQLTTADLPTRQLLTTPNKMVDSLLDNQRRVYNDVCILLVKRAKDQASKMEDLPNWILKSGDLVKLQYGLKTTLDCPKLDPYWEGPYCIDKALGQDAYSLKLPPGTRFQNRFHIDRLRPWVESDLTLFSMDRAAQPLDQLPTSVQKLDETQTQIAQYLVRDFRSFPEEQVQYSADRMTDKHSG